MGFKAGQKLSVFNVRTAANGSAAWALVGSATVNKDGSLTVLLDVLPVDGKLHIRAVAKEG